MKRCLVVSRLSTLIPAVLAGTAAIGMGGEPKIVGGPVLPYGHLIGNGGFEDGFTSPWGTRVEHEKGPLWFRQGNVMAKAAIDSRVKKAGSHSLRISNSSPRATGSYAETCQVMVTEPEPEEPA